MSTVLRVGPNRFFFYPPESIQTGDRPHIHIDSGDKLVKFWLQPVRLASSHRYTSDELIRLRLLVEAYRETFLQAWHQHVGTPQVAPAVDETEGIGGS